MLNDPPFRKATVDTRAIAEKVMTDVYGNIPFHNVVAAELVPTVAALVDLGAPRSEVTNFICNRIPNSGVARDVTDTIYSKAGR